MEFNVSLFIFMFKNKYWTSGRRSKLYCCWDRYLGNYNFRCSEFAQIVVPVQRMDVRGARKGTLSLPCYEALVHGSQTILGLEPTHALQFSGVAAIVAIATLG